MTTTITRTATIISFRARADIEDARTLREVQAIISTHNGTMLGTTGDGFDVIAAFHSEGTAMRFLNQHYEGDLDGPIGAYVITDATI